MTYLQVSPTHVYLPGLEPRDPLRLFLHKKLRYEIKDTRNPYKHSRWAEVEHLLEKHQGVYRFPRGMLEQMWPYLCHLPGFVDQIHPYKTIITSGPTLRPYQIPAVAEMLKSRTPGRTGGILRVGTGGGKSEMMAACIQVRQRKTLVVVESGDLLTQNQKRLQAILGVPVGHLDGKKKIIQDVTVGTSQTLLKSPGLISQVNDMWFDEVHHAACDRIQKVASFAHNVDFIGGLSASPWRDDGKDILIEAVCGPVRCQISASDLIDQGWLVAPVIRIWKRRLPPDLKKFKSEEYADAYRALIFDPVRNLFVLDLLYHHIRDGRRPLVLVRHIEHVEELQRLWQTTYPKDQSLVFLTGSDTGREKVIERIRQGSIRGLVATSIADEGLDIPALDALILAGAGRSSTRALQRIGRVLRPAPGKSQAIVDEIVDQHALFQSQFRVRRDMYLTEPRFQLEYFDVGYAANLG